MKKVIVTKHAKARMKERAMRKKNYKTMLNMALTKGKTMEQFEPEFYKYLNRKSNKRVKIRVYGNFIYVISRAKKTLITMYEAPERFIPTSEHEILNCQRHLFYDIDLFKGRKIKIRLKNGVPIYGLLEEAYISNEDIIESICIKTDLNIEIFIDTKDVEIIKLDKNFITDDLYDVLEKEAENDKKKI